MNFLTQRGSLSPDLSRHFAIFVAHQQLNGPAGSRQRITLVDYKRSHLTALVRPDGKVEFDNQVNLRSVFPSSCPKALSVAHSRVKGAKE
jgi:hypothetical protein